MKLVAISSAAAAIFAAWLAHSLTDARWEVKYQKLEKSYDETVAESKDKSLQIERLARENVDLLADAIFADIGRQEALSQTTEVEVIRYVESDGAGDCDLDFGWLRAHDARAGFVSGAAPTEAGNAQGASGVTEADALEVISGNYGLCADAYAQVRWWISYNETVLEPYRQRLETLRAKR